MIYKAVNTETGNVVGHISLTAVNRSNRSARITRVLARSSADRGKGIGEQITLAAMRIALDELKLHRMSLGVFDFNTPAILEDQ